MRVAILNENMTDVTFNSIAFIEMTMHNDIVVPYLYILHLANVDI